MKHLFSAKPLIAAAIALSAFGAASMAQAQVHDGGRRSIAVGEPYGHQQPVPPVYNHDNRYDNRQRGGPFGDSDRDGIQNRFDRDSRFYDHREAQRHAMWGDADRDGVPNRFDRAPYNPRVR